MYPLITADRLRRFDEKTMPEPNSGCLLWLAGTNEHGYGIFWNGEWLEKAHRFAFRVFRKIDLLPETDVCHSCDNTFCVNAWHLFAGDALANTTDMWAKSRATVISRFGEAQIQAKLSDDKADRIRRLYATGRYKQRDLADEFDVSQRLIWNVIHYKNWFRESGIVVATGRGK